MSNPKQIKSLFILCDECGWKDNNADIHGLYAGLKCPECNAIVITEQDMVAINNTKKLIKLDNLWRKLTFWKRERQETQVHITTDRMGETGERTTIEIMPIDEQA